MSRRTLVAGAALSVPAIALMTTTPAFAVSGDQISSFSSVDGRILASGATSLTAIVQSSSGSPVAGAAVSFTGPNGSSFAPATATSNGAGSATTSVNLNKPWIAPGKTATITALTGSSSRAATLTVLGANVFVAGDGAAAGASQESLVFPSPIAQYVSMNADTTGGANNSQTARMVLLENGTVWMAGPRNGNGQLGDGTTTGRSTWAQVAGLSGVTEITAGPASCYALLSDGTVMAWGRNEQGQLGDGTTNDVLSPQLVAGLTGVKHIHAATGCAAAHMSDGTVKTWGFGANGRLGSGSSANVSSPTTVPGVSGVKQFAYCFQTGLALLDDGSMIAWGGNQSGTCGDGTTTDRYTPVTVGGLTGVSVTAIAASLGTAMALSSDGIVRTWGAPTLGDGTTNSASTPTIVPGLSQVTAIAGLFQSCFALLGDGTVQAWGRNTNGELGDGTKTNRLSPVAVTGFSGRPILKLGNSSNSGIRPGFIAQTDGNTVSLLSTANGRILATGATALTATVISAAGDPESGAAVSFTGPSGATFTPTSATSDGAGRAATSVDLATPWIKPGKTVTVSAESGSSSLSATLGVLGANFFTVGGSTSTPSQGALVFPSPVAQILSFNENTANATLPDPSGSQIARLEDGTVWTIGPDNDKGQLGDGTTTSRSTWEMVAGISDAVDISANGQSCYVVLSDGTVMAWGRNGRGQLGDGTTTDASRPQFVPGLNNAKMIHTGNRTVGALLSDGTVATWGNGANGRLGHGSTTDVASPTVIPGLTGVSQFVYMSATGIALHTDGTVSAWGLNAAGQCGDGTTTDRYSPVTVTGLSDLPVKAIAASAGTGLALMSDGTVRTWGAAPLGDGTADYRTTAAPVSGLSNVTAISGGFQSCFALLADGTVKAWGRNLNGQLGDGTTIFARFSPVTVTGLSSRTIVGLSKSHTGGVVSHFLAQMDS